MATSGPTLAPAYLSGDVDFRAFAQAIHDKLAAVGLVQTADTGQINLATVARPASANGVGGYEIWRFDDALQATLPVFIKIEYGVAGTVDRPSLWVTVGTATNGAGTITGQAGSRIQASAIASKTAGVQLPVYASGDGSRLALLANFDATVSNYMILVAVERTRDASGNNTADGISVATNGSFGGQAIPASGSIPGTGSGPLIPLGTYGQAVVGQDIAVSTMVFFLGKPFYGIGLVGVSGAASVPKATSFQATVLGQARTYLTGNDNGGSAFYAYSGSPLPAILWE